MIIELAQHETTHPYGWYVLITLGVFAAVWAFFFFFVRAKYAHEQDEKTKRKALRVQAELSVLITIGLTMMTCASVYTAHNESSQKAWIADEIREGTGISLSVEAVPTMNGSVTTITAPVITKGNGDRVMFDKVLVSRHADNINVTLGKAIPILVPKEAK